MFLQRFFDDPFLPLTPHQERLTKHILEGCVTEQKPKKIYVSMPYHNGKRYYDYLNDILEKGESNA